MSPIKNNQACLAVYLLLCMPICHAELADRNKPLHLESDQVLIDDAKKISTFTGNVQLTQGTMLILGDKIIVKQSKDGFKHGTIFGNTATFRQKREGLDEYVEGSGERIEYDTRAEEVNFHTHARVKRGLDELRGEHITYNIKTEVFQVNSGITKPGDASPKRVRAVLQPKPKHGAATSAVPESPPARPGNTLTPAE
jgi:lipopolysaccharide export system protein LptA